MADSTRAAGPADATARGPGAGDATEPLDLRRVQAIELEVLREFQRRCEAENLRWFVIGGTLLGAARHHGFIPWDDDIDVGMPRPDYERFAALCLRTPDHPFGWQSTATEPAYPFMYGKLIRAGTQAPEPALAHLPIRHGLGIDVFPLDGAPGSTIGRIVHGLAIKLAVTALGARLRRSGLRRYLSWAFRAVPRAWSLRLIGLLARAFRYDASPYVVNASGAWGYRRECQPRSRFEPPTSLAFEGLTVPAPGRWHAYLAHIYGDYMELPPPEQRRPRHMPKVIAFGGPDDMAGPPGTS